jgi:hypothetical protein
MRTVISALALLACASFLEAQIVASLNRSAAGTPEVRIRNDAAVSLAAFAVAMNPSAESDDRTPFLAFFDTVLDDTTPLDPKRERAVPVLFRSRPGKQIEALFDLPIITAGIFSDGTTTGDAVLLTRLIERRSNMLLAVHSRLCRVPEGAMYLVIS